MLQVIGAGFPRTGTGSMKAALDRLGLGPCHHMFEIFAHPAQVERWLTLLDDGPANWEWILEGYRSVVDLPGGFFWRELAAAHPDAKVVLTLRDPHRWYDSMNSTIFQAAKAPFPPENEERGPTMNSLLPLLDMIWKRTYGVGRHEIPTQEQAVRAFERNIAEVRETIPAQRLLVFEAAQGWEPLCEFLGVPVPEGEPYPHLNDGAAMRAFLDKAHKGEPAALPGEDQARR